MIGPYATSNAKQSTSGLGQTCYMLGHQGNTPAQDGIQPTHYMGGRRVHGHSHSESTGLNVQDKKDELQSALRKG